ncbi:putative galacturonosyltransferase 7-like protein, partial [Trifolium pratense]
DLVHANFTMYFAAGFWSEPPFAAMFEKRRVCYFNTEVIVMYGGGKKGAQRR